jgi:glycosyltransferase involved in cell wall biosynthesis
MGGATGRVVDARLRVLYLTHHGPWPAGSGGRLRDAALIPEVARLADVEVWAISRTAEADLIWLESGPADTTVRIYSDDGPRLSYPTRDSVAARQALLRRMSGPKAFDVIHVEGHYLFHLLPEQARDRAVVVEHNVESHLLRQRARHHGLTPALAAAIDAVGNAEERVWARAPLTLTLSEEDRARIQHRVAGARVRVSTNGADHLALTPAERGMDAIGDPPAPRLGFLANYAYSPNRDGLAWLLDEILPGLRQRLPGCQLVLVGSNLDDALAGRRLPQNVAAQGWVHDLSTFWNQIDLMVCPLRIGGGVKVKVIEAIRSGALVVSTSVGLEGLPPPAREAIVQADSAPAFVDAVVRLSVDRSLRRAQRARLTNAQQALPTWAAVARSLYGQWLSIGQTVLGGVVAE